MRLKRAFMQPLGSLFNIDDTSEVVQLVEIEGQRYMMYMDRGTDPILTEDGLEFRDECELLLVTPIYLNSTRMFRPGRFFTSCGIS